MKRFNEKVLVQKLDKILKKQFDTNTSFREFSAGYGIADLVFARGFSFSVSKMRKRAPVTSFIGLQLLFSMEQYRVYSRQEILGLVDRFDEKAVLRQLSLLIKYEYLEKISGDTYSKCNDKDSLNPIKSVVAIEVKLNDHKAGLLQANRYKYFADESYLAILKESERNINFEEFNKHNIGLILFDPLTDTIEIRYPSRDNTFEGKINYYAKELMVEKFLKSSL